MPKQKINNKKIKPKHLDNLSGDQEKNQETSLTLSTMSHSKLANFVEKNEIWSDPKIYKDQDFRNKVLEKDTADYTISQNLILAADQLFDHIKSLADSFVASYKSDYRLTYNNVQYKVDFNMPQFYVQSFVPLEIGKDIVDDIERTINIPKEKQEQYKKVFAKFNDYEITDEECAMLSNRPQRKDMCALYYRMYEKNGDEFEFNYISSPKKPNDNSALFGSIGSPEPISTPDPNYTFLFVFLRDFILGDEYKIIKEPHQIISSKFHEIKRSADKKVLEQIDYHNLEQFLTNFQVSNEDSNKPLVATVYNESTGEIDYAEPRLSILKQYGEAFKAHILKGLSSVYPQMQTLYNVEKDQYVHICKTSFIGSPLPFLHQMICQDIIQLSKYILDDYAEESFDNRYEALDNLELKDSALQSVEEPQEDL
ncbi:hypothetical protein [Candidatus Bandiella euplotis]|uniref:Uncharacterized protein n=1 Tax=Candidatus Bandiella euplotis TaxID=1664265 RepID=A0ABZ0UJC1_9RICK|nr:hypothetical protein [Candidatus Bandiella woodruffii]WPX96205.1 hypothetical protein Bandiella_00314 [Candidatus Bandiella woodruffii]